ncbi:glycosyltransferase family 1 protein [soil metagenome]
MIRIAIDGNEANVENRVGSNAYAFELLVSLEKILRQRGDISVTVLLASPALTDFPEARENWKYIAFGPVPFWTQWALPWYLFNFKSSFDVVFTPGHYAPRYSPVPYVSSVMDLAYIHFPKQFKKKDQLQLSEWTRYSVRHAKKVIAISEFTKQAIIDQYKLPADKIVVAYPGIRQAESSSIKEKDKIATLHKWHIKRPYLLYVGTLQPRKNLVNLIAAFELVVKNAKQDIESNKKKKAYVMLDAGKLESLQLVIAGKIGWLAEPISKRAETSPLNKRIILTGYISEIEKKVLYKEALATVLVGLYEGFGIPPLEAMAAGTLPIVSNNTSLPEVVGEAGILVDPNSVQSIAQGIKRVLILPAKEKAGILKKGRQQIKKFDWDRSAQIVLDTLIEVAKRHDN